MADVFWLEAGEDGSDRLDLMSGEGATHGITVVASGRFDIVPDASDPRYQIVTIPLVFKGTNKNQVLGYRRQVLAKLEQARGGAQPGSLLPKVNIGIRLHGASEMVRWFVESGELTRGDIVALPSNVIGSANESADLILRCYAGGVGEVIEYGPYTVAGDTMTLHIDGIPGDMPAVAEMVIEDESTGAAINRIRWAARSLPDLDEGDLPVILPFGTGGEDPDAVNGTPVVESVDSIWQDIASVTQDADFGGIYDVFARLRDETEYLGQPGVPVVNWTPGLILRQSSTSETFANPTLAGSLLVVLIVNDSGGSISTPTDFTQAATVNHSSGNGPRVSLFYRENAPVTNTISGTSGRVTIKEFLGVKTSGALDETATGQLTGAPLSVGPTGTLSQAYSLVVGGFGASSSSSALGFTNPGLSSITQNGSSPSALSRLGHTVAASTGGESADQSASGSSGAISLLRQAGIVAVFTAAEPSAPTVPAGEYSFAVAAIDSNGRTSPVSETGTTTTTNTGALYFQWAASSGTVVKYRLYLRQGSGAWMYFDTTDDTPELTIRSLSDKDGDADPPAESDIELGDFRFFFGRPNVAMQQPPIGPFRAAIGNDTWEWIYLRRMHLPPSSSPLVGTPTGWSAVVQGRAVAPTNLGVDALALLPADEGNSGEAWYVPNDLTTPAVWRVWSTIHGYSNGYLSDGSDETGNLRVRGRLALGPGDTTMVLLPTVAGNVSKVEDVSMKVTIWARPRYYWLAGAP